MSFFQTPTCVHTIWQGVERHPGATFRWIKMLISTTSCCCFPHSIVLVVWSGKSTASRKPWQVFGKKLSLFCSLYIFSDFSVSCNCFFSLVPWPYGQRWLRWINSVRHTAKRRHSHFKDIKNVPNNSPQSRVCCTAVSYHWCKLQRVCINWGTKLSTENKSKHNQVLKGTWDGPFAEQWNISTLWDKQIVKYHVLIGGHSNVLRSCVTCI